MLFTSLLPRLCTAAPRLARPLTTKGVQRPIPSPRGIDSLPPAHLAHSLTSTSNVETIATPDDFLKAIGRESETKLSVESWEELWKTSGEKLKESGLAVRDRRYILWCMEKYRQGLAIKDFAHEPRPKKTVRGWGPKVQNGKRIRSRRDKYK
ncbi:IGR protein motif-domain-containing protein [Crucibulum laeve]|uniref:Small ribosomal subunit protein mS41 n=1 Tax=Crucibulum laeve TaxID=68775 RepID=A0A5C3M5S2_9AGAR|nr:IGR protein motif-domain-containing protein [Crucibulum laeve]